MSNQNQPTKRQGILPAGHPDPMLMSLAELKTACDKATGKLHVFLHGVLYARVSIRAAGAPLNR